MKINNHTLNKIYHVTRKNTFKLILDKNGSPLLDLCGPGVHSDRKYNLIQKCFYTKIILTDSDLLCHDDYLQFLKDYEITVILYFSNMPHSPSEKRIEKCQAKLKHHGVKTKRVKNRSEGLEYMAKLSNRLAVGKYNYFDWI